MSTKNQAVKTIKYQGCWHQLHAEQAHPQSAFFLYALCRYYAKQDVDNPFSWLDFRTQYMRREKIRRKHHYRYCQYCGKKMRMKGSKITQKHVTVDHVIPISQGGKRFSECNMRLICRGCNQEKADKTPLQYIAYLMRGIKISKQRTHTIRKVYYFLIRAALPVWIGKVYCTDGG